MAKKFLMTTLWRISQTGPFLSIFFWGTALAGIFWPILGQRNPPGPLYWFVTQVLGVGDDRATLVGIALLFLLFVGTIFAFGFVYDRVLKLWREQTEVAYARNPYADDTLFRKEILTWDQFYLPLARALYKVSPDPDLKAAIARVERWVATGKMEPKPGPGPEKR